LELRRSKRSYAKGFGRAKPAYARGFGRAMKVEVEAEDK